MIKVTQVSKAYHGQTAVENMDLHVETGESVGLVGVPMGQEKQRFYECSWALYLQTRA